MFSVADFEEELLNRSGSKCELCESQEDIKALEVSSVGLSLSTDTCAILCGVCRAGLKDPKSVSEYHWACLHGTIWSPLPAIQVLSWRLLNYLSEEGWAQDLLGQMFLDDDTMAWAQDDGQAEPTLDSNGDQLHDGDNVFVIKDLNVKGASFVAKRGTTVRNIRLSPDPEYIQGKVNGSQIMLKTCFIKKV
jgi:protein PhnA